MTWSTSPSSALAIGPMQHGQIPVCLPNRARLVAKSKAFRAPAPASARLASRWRLRSLLLASYALEALFIQARQKPRSPPAGVEPKNSLVAGFFSPQRVQIFSNASPTPPTYAASIATRRLGRNRVANYGRGVLVFAASRRRASGAKKVLRFVCNLLIPLRPYVRSFAAKPLMFLVVKQPSKLMTRVRFPSPAPIFSMA